MIMNILLLTFISNLFAGCATAGNGVKKFDCKKAIHYSKRCKAAPSATAETAKKVTRAIGERAKSAVTPVWLPALEYIVEDNPKLFKKHQKNRNRKYHGLE